MTDVEELQVIADRLAAIAENVESESVRGSLLAARAEVMVAVVELGEYGCEGLA